MVNLLGATLNCFETACLCTDLPPRAATWASGSNDCPRFMYVKADWYTPRLIRVVSTGLRVTPCRVQAALALPWCSSSTTPTAQTRFQRISNGAGGHAPWVSRGQTLVVEITRSPAPTVSKDSSSAVTDLGTVLILWFPRLNFPTP